MGLGVYKLPIQIQQHKHINCHLLVPSHEELLVVLQQALLLLLVQLLLHLGVLLLQTLRLLQVPLYLPDPALHVDDGGQFPLEEVVETVEVVLDVAPYFVGLVPEAHVLLRQLDGLVYVALVLLYQLFLLLQNQLYVLVMLLTQLLYVLRSLGSSAVDDDVAVSVVGVAIGSEEVIEGGWPAAVVKVAHVGLDGVGGVADGRYHLFDRLLPVLADVGLGVWLGRRVLRTGTHSMLRIGRYYFGLVATLIHSVPESLGVLSFLHVLLALGVVWSGLRSFRSHSISRQHEFFLQLVDFVQVERLFPGFFQLFDPIGVLEGIEGVFGAAAVG